MKVDESSSVVHSEAKRWVEHTLTLNTLKFLAKYTWIRFIGILVLSWLCSGDTGGKFHYRAHAWQFLYKSFDIEIEPRPAHVRSYKQVLFLRSQNVCRVAFSTDGFAMNQESQLWFPTISILDQLRIDLFTDKMVSFNHSHPFFVASPQTHAGTHVKGLDPQLSLQQCLLQLITATHQRGKPWAYCQPCPLPVLPSVAVKGCQHLH